MTLGKLCQQPWLLAGLTLLCLLLPLSVGPAAEAALSQGVSFSGLTLAVTAPEGDALPELLERYIPNMADVREYCQVVALDRETALRRLEEGEVTAVLVLPENLAQGIMNGDNPDVEVIVAADKPLEALLTLSVGQSASDILASVQSGIYAVLEAYVELSPGHLSYADAVNQINLRYVRWTLGRQNMFLVDPIAVTSQLPVRVHYGLSLLAYLGFCLAPLFMAVYDGAYLRAQRRYRAAGRGSLSFYTASVTGCTLVLLPLMILVPLILNRGDVAATVWTGALGALLCASFGSVCCLLTPNTGSCGMVSFLSALVFLFLGGGVLPPVLLPRTLQKLLPLSPVTWLRSTLAMPVEEYEISPGYALAVAVVAAALVILGGVLYSRRVSAGEDTL